MTNMDYVISDYPLDETEVSSSYPFKTKSIPILDSTISYIDEGKGNVILFLHGIPSWNYIWRNIIPTIAKQARCIAPDLIGFGRSGKPNINYTIQEHINYIENFINTLGLKNITLVMHEWGSIIGLNYAFQYPDNVKALAFTEAYLRPITDNNMVSLPVQELATFNRTSDSGYTAIMKKNYYLETVLPNIILRPLSNEELEYYHEPFRTPGSATPLWQYSQEYPLGNNTSANAIISQYSTWLQYTNIPKLMMYSIPGYVTTIDTLQWVKNYLPNSQLIDVGCGLHFPQEENPSLFTEALSMWLNKICIQTKEK